MSVAWLAFEWARAFAFTQIVEAPIYRRVLSVSWRHALTASAVTHPIVWFAFPALLGNGSEAYWRTVAVAELFAWSVEATYFCVACNVPLRRALLVSFLANAASVALGLLSRHFFGAP